MTKQEILSHLSAISDPEIPVLSIMDLGIIREILFHSDETLEVVITPTYSGCPAMDMIEVDIKATLQDLGIQKTKVTTILTPAWTTDWLTESGRQKLLDYGIVPPVKESSDKLALFGKIKGIHCPLCHSPHTEMIAQFGSTACKALYKCLDCKEPFDYFKCH
jgi:ring-1,2-phenylacetyl-CoA epoxidase subunit PaaD